jgi:mercuric ion binding protein
MNLACKNLILAAGACLLLTATAFAETKVTMKGVHLCCPQCVTAVEKTLADIEGAKGQCNQEGKTIIITADNDAAAQKALDALADAGFHGKIDNDKLKFKKVETPKGNVQRLELSGMHNCCGMCAKFIKAAIKEVKGVQSDNVTPKKGEFVVEGNFSAEELVKAMLDAGFHVKVKK